MPADSGASKKSSEKQLKQNARSALKSQLKSGARSAAPPKFNLMDFLSELK